MEKNVGETDKLVRIVLGALLGLISLGILADFVPLQTVLSPILGVVSIVLLVTGFTSKCMLYNLLGMDTSE